MLENAVTCHGFTLTGVPMQQMEGLCDRVVTVLTQLADASKELLDMQRMRTIIKNQMLQILNQVSCG